MPLANLTNMTDAERSDWAAWYNRPCKEKMTTHAERRRWIDAHFDEEVGVLQQVLRVPTDTPPGNNAPHADMVAHLVKAYGWPPRSTPCLRPGEAYGMQSITNLIVRRLMRRAADRGAERARRRGAAGRQLDLSAIWRRGRRRLYLRPRAAVSKCDFATYVFAARALEALGMPLKGQLELHFTYDEEFGGLLGPGWLLEQNLTKPDYVIAAGFSYNIVTAHNACLQLEITVHGKSGHGAMPETGHDALQAANAILNAIYGQLPELKKIKSTVAGIDSPTMLVGRIDGGTNTNVVPGKVVLKMDRRMIPEEDPVAVEAQVRALIEDAVRGVPGIRIEIRRLLLSHALRPCRAPSNWWPACKECANHHRRKIPPSARRCMRMRACMASMASRRCCMAPARARCRNRTPRRPTSDWRWTTCARPARSSP
jgi:hypothetical protein